MHSARISNDGLLYVSDRANRRVQVFTPEGKYITQVFLSRLKWPPSTLTGMLRGTPLAKLQDGLYNAGMTASRTAFSPDKEQRFLYVIDRPRQQIAILDRESLEILGYFGGGIGGDPGQFYVLHDIADVLLAKPSPPQVASQRDHAFAISLMEHLVVPTFVIDADGRVLIWNKACERLTGFSASEVVGGRECES